MNSSNLAPTNIVLTSVTNINVLHSHVNLYRNTLSVWSLSHTLQKFFGFKFEINRLERNRFYHFNFYSISVNDLEYDKNWFNREGVTIKDRD